VKDRYAEDYQEWDVPSVKGCDWINSGCALLARLSIEMHPCFVGD